MTCRKVDKKFETAYSEEKLLGYIIKLSRLTADEALYIPRRSVCYVAESEDGQCIVVSHIGMYSYEVQCSRYHRETQSHERTFQESMLCSPKQLFHHCG